MNITHLGEAKFKSPFTRSISEDLHVPEQIVHNIKTETDSGLQFELAGPREKIFFDPAKTRAGIVTCGGLCPGLNDVIRSLFNELVYAYGVAEVIGFRGGYQGLDPDAGTNRKHALIVVAEGAGQDLLEESNAARDASGNVLLKDIGLFMREKIESYFKIEQIPIMMRYIDPSYIIRSSPANAEDSILCDLFARNAVHAAMAGKTGLVIGYLHDKFIHVPIELLTSRTKTMDTNGLAWSAVLASTGQPEQFR